MHTNKLRSSTKRKCSIGFVLTTILFSIALFFHCFDENPADDWLPTFLEIKVTPSAHEKPDDRTFFVGENISVCIQVLEIAPIDSIVFGIIKNPEVGSTEESIKAAVDTVLHRGEISSVNDLTICLDQPGSFLFGAYARSKDTIAVDTVYVTVVEDSIKNESPVVHVNLLRAYAAPTLPCSLRVSFSNQECWQIVKLLGDSMEQNITCIGDSICTWVPSGSDISKTYLLRIVAIDNGKPPKIGDTTITVAVIPDNRQPNIPQDLRIAERSTEMVKLVWKMDSLVDGYTVLRRWTSGITSWDTVGKTKLAEFVDSTDTVFMYRVVANNYFGTTASGTDIVARDTVHYAHAIGFERGQSPSVSENDSVCVIKLQVSQAAKVPISVWLSAKGNSADSADTDDYKLQTPQVVFEKGNAFADVRLRITNDEKIEPPESLTITIDSVSSGYIAGILQHKVVIADNDTLYKVSYDKNGADSGTVPMDSGSYKRGAKVTVKGNTGTLKKNEYTFSGWNTSSDGKGDAYAAGAQITMSAGNVILYAWWTADTGTVADTLYSVTYDGNGATGGTVPNDSIKYTSGAAVTVPGSGTLVKTGYSFTGWNTKPNGSGTSYLAEDNFVMPAAPVFFYAQWKITTYTVTYLGNGHIGGTEPPVTNHFYNSTVVMPGAGSLVKTGHLFFGWNTEPAGNGIDYIAGASFTMGAGNDTMYARWTTNTYNITFDKNDAGASGSMQGQSIVFGTSANLTANGYVKTGYSFAGWATSSGGNVVYANGAVFTMATEGAALYAKWTPIPCKVIFNSQGGSAVDTQIVNYSDTIRTPGVSTRTGYTFSGWYTDAASTKLWTFGTGKVMGDTILYAKWTINRYKVTFNSQGGSTVDSQMVNYNDTARTPTAPSKTGYTFSGWYREAACTNLWILATDNVTGNVTLYAKWTPITYTITYNLNGGTNGSNPTGYTIQSATIALANATKISYVFDGWYSDVELTVLVTEIPSGSTGNRELWAKWVIKDADGNIYTEVTIGSQVWMVENLKTTIYRDGTPIPNVTDNTTWVTLSTPGYCWYFNNELSYKEPYGALYNWYTVSTGNLAPAGWHVPTDAEWTVLSNYLGGDSVAGDKMKVTGTTTWHVLNSGATNESGFSAFPGGTRYPSIGEFDNMHVIGGWWSATEDDGKAWECILSSTTADLSRFLSIKSRGNSVRCLRD